MSKQLNEFTRSLVTKGRMAKERKSQGLESANNVIDSTYLKYCEDLAFLTIPDLDETNEDIKSKIAAKSGIDSSSILVLDLNAVDKFMASTLFNWSEDQKDKANSEMNLHEIVKRVKSDSPAILGFTLLGLTKTLKEEYSLVILRGDVQYAELEPLRVQNYLVMFSYDEDDLWQERVLDLINFNEVKSQKK